MHRRPVGTEGDIHLTVEACPNPSPISIIGIFILIGEACHTGIDQPDTILTEGILILIPAKGSLIIVFISSRLSTYLLSMQPPLQASVKDILLQGFWDLYHM